MQPDAFCEVCEYLKDKKKGKQKAIPTSSGTSTNSGQREYEAEAIHRIQIYFADSHGGWRSVYFILLALDDSSVT